MNETIRNPDPSRTARAVRPKREQAPLCAAVRVADGAPCPVRAIPGDRHCYQHSERPETVARRAEARRKGGSIALALRRAAPELPAAAEAFASREKVRAYLEQLADAVVRGRITAAQSNAVANLAGVVLRIEELALSAKIAALEEQLTTDERRGALAPRIVVTRAGSGAQDGE